ncbi:hypothetical protein [Devosia elaeis]|uniref:Uncharacterized protein n=1 Tax=Devosia elaeis TaxID=1770058 RepID=A0A178HLP1_9HYPH|nr:hypothetical protein [Devosia elaeis]OAM73743.1 hypothetical protein A3840_17260 [Devosia elaeis]
MKSDLVDIDVQIHARTERAILVSDDGEREGAVWLPLAVEVAAQGKHHVVTMPEWLAVDRGLI